MFDHNPTNTENTSWCVYFIQSTSGFTKIGMSNDADRRVKELQVGSAEPLYLQARIMVKSQEDALRLEAMLHDRYKDYHQNGEWFSVDLSEILDEVSYWVRFCSAIDGIQRYETIERIYVERMVKDTITERSVSNFTPPTSPTYYRRTTPNARAIVLEHLQQYPNDAYRNVRDLAEYLGVSKSTVNEAQLQYREQHTR